MKEAVVVASSRTPLAKSFRGSFNLTRPDELAAHAIKDVLGKAPELAAEEITDVILGCGQPHGPAGNNVARVSTILAGLPATAAARHRPPVRDDRLAHGRHARQRDAAAEGQVRRGDYVRGRRPGRGRSV